jgi:hypothetical protein
MPPGLINCLEIVSKSNEPWNRPHFRPHISATPRDQTDSEQHDSLKIKDMCNETDTEQPMEGSF